jgi:hypothetical protein
MTIGSGGSRDPKSSTTTLFFYSRDSIFSIPRQDHIRFTPFKDDLTRDQLFAGLPDGDSGYGKDFFLIELIQSRCSSRTPFPAIYGPPAIFSSSNIDEFQGNGTTGW